ncbi:PAS domain S-box protein [Hymenobacter sp. DH14]|uniref:histidine kinase n=1 Tax=Hymenobacter cyanobacteriorum TaxID=2926463 RepID=A0A9X2AGQ5_9BACT|nr:PAS domain S-box protein [Hymenobacter cyanobacteriorum]MCI1189097.1 PAS domain S-box protein [Hymenobacter cyanobacteriorum]
MPAATPADPTSPHAQEQALRARAEAHRRLVTQAAAPLAPEETQRLVQELQVHQIELEMQNEELLLAQAEAEQARTRYVDLYEFAPVGYFSLSEVGAIEQLNLCGSQLLGPVRQRLLGRRFALFVAPAQRLEFGQFLARVFSTDTTQRAEVRLLREDETLFHGLLEGLRVLTPAGPQCRLAVLDVTDRRRATDALATSEARFRKLFTDSHDAVALLQGSLYVDCNAAALRLLGAERRDQLVGHPAWAHTPEFQPDGSRTIDQLRACLDAALAAGSTRCEILMRRVSGDEIWVEAVFTPIEVGGPAPLVHILWRDITASRAAAQQLRASEARLSLALAASQTGVFTWDFATRQVEGDPAVQAMFGRASGPGFFPLEDVQNRIHRHDLPRLWGGLQAAIAVQEPLEVSFRVVWADGSVHHLGLAGRVVTNEPGHATGFTGVLRDVTRQRAADEELHYKSLVLERMLHRMPMVLTRLKPDGTYIESEGAGLQAVGIEPGSLVGHNVHEMYPNVQPELVQVLQGGQAEFLAEIPTAAGLPVAFQNYAFFDEQGQQVVVLAVDVTAAEQQRRQLQAEQDFTRNLLENSVDCIISLDAQGRVTVWNAEAARYFGLSAAQALGRPLAEVVPMLGEYSLREVARALAGERIDRFNREFQLRAGRYDAHLVPLPSPVEGQSGGVLVILRDVTERERLAEEATQLRLRQQQEVLAAILETQETERKRIAEALHNGLGQLLYATKLSLDNRGELPPAPRDSLRLLEEAIRTTRTISFELTPGILEDFGLRIALETLVKRIAPARLPVHLHLRNLDQRLPALVEIAVYRTVQELLNNVMKHAHATEVEVHVAHENGRLYVSVEDNGRGFEPALLATEPLAGIGLAGVRNRVALLGGELSVRSQRGRGTIISFDAEV